MYKSVVGGKGGISAKVVADSITKEGSRITTMELAYHRFIHGEFMTHRQFSRNASSSRAIPVKTMLENIEDNPAVPIHWGKNQAGMQANEECNSYVFTEESVGWDAGREEVWKYLANESSDIANRFADAGYHKQIVNRITEPYQFIKVVCTSTEWDNFFKLRLHKDAQPEIEELARCMKQAMEESEPETLSAVDYHLPYITEGEQGAVAVNEIAYNGEDFYLSDGVYMTPSKEYPDLCLMDLIKCSVARCARVSYLNHDNSSPDIEKDIALADMLLEAGHMSPFEHVAVPMMFPKTSEDDWGVFNERGQTHIDFNGDYWSGNFKHYIQYRQTLGDK